MATQTSVIPRYSIWGQAQFYITYEDTTWRVTGLRIDNDASVPAKLRVWLNDTPNITELEYIAQPGEDRSQSIPPGQDYFLDQYNFSFQFVSPT